LRQPIDKKINFDTKEFAKYGTVYYDLLKICTENNIKLITYIAPIEGQFLKVPYTKNLINHSDLLDNTKFFADELHVNPIGRQIATTAFANIFVKKIK
jgi:hypothetical protein